MKPMLIVLSVYKIVISWKKYKVISAQHIQDFKHMRDEPQTLTKIAWIAATCSFF